MATPAWSPRFLRLVNVWRLLSARNDVDNLILELLGHFSLEKIYAGGDQQAYQQLVTSLLIQLNAVFYVQRMSLPSADVQVGPYLGILASWEITARSVEFVLQTIVEGRESLLSAHSLRDKYLAETLLSALRLLVLHPKPPVSPRAKDRRDRYGRIHRLLERIFEKYPGPIPLLLSICRETTNCLRADPHALSLPPKLRLPDLRSKMYPLADCLSSQYISTIVPPKDPSGAWLPYFFTLRDVALFVVGASVQCAVNEETETIDLQLPSSTVWDAVARSLDDLQVPPYLSRTDLVAIFDETFQIILPDTSASPQQDLTATLVIEDEIDALDMLSTKLGKRQVLQRASDKEMAHHISEVTRQISILDDPIDHRSTSPSLYAVNCPSCHIVGGSQLRHSQGTDFWTAIDRLTPEPHVKTGLEQTSCIHCGETVTVAREIPLARTAWGLLKPLESETDTLDLERHLAASFQLSPPSIEASTAPNPPHGQVWQASDYGLQGNVPSPPYQSQPLLPGSTSLDRLLSASDIVSPTTVTFSPRVDFQVKSTLVKQPDPYDIPHTAAPITPDVPFSPDHVGIHRDSLPQTDPLDHIESALSSDPGPLLGSDLTSSTTTLVKRKSKWRSRWTVTRRNSTAASGDTSSLSSATLESQKLEEISLDTLIRVSKSSLRGRHAKKVNIYLSQNSTDAIFWTQAAIHVWDVGTSPPTMKRSFSPESSCVLAAVTKIHLAYIVGTRDQKLTLRIINLEQPLLPVVEHRMSSSLWCRSIAICPNEECVAVGFENSMVRFFKLSNTDSAQEFRLHSRFHKDCRGCPAVDTLSFSNDGMVLLASTRNPKSGTIQIYSWKAPFSDFQELPFCRYNVPLLESEDNGISAAIARSRPGEEDLICITTWTQSGIPVLIQPQDGHKTEIKTDISSRQGKLGNRIQCAAFSHSGTELAMVNDKGYLYHITNLDSAPMQIKRMATSIELTARSDAFGMAFVTLHDEDAIVLAWVDAVKSVCLVKKIPIMPHGDISMPATPAVPQVPSRFELPGDSRDAPRPPVELPVV